MKAEGNNGYLRASVIGEQNEISGSGQEPPVTSPLQVRNRSVILGGDWGVEKLSGKEVVFNWETVRDLRVEVLLFEIPFFQGDLLWTHTELFLSWFTTT